jgi:deoxyribodipyrimidine photo-lyase
VNKFNIVKQSKDYDQNGDYVRHWLPELKNVPTQFVHEPWKMSQFHQAEYGCRLGVQYPNPITQPYEFKSKDGSGSKGDRKNNDGRRNNPNRGKGQRKDMKSMKKGQFSMD